MKKAIFFLSFFALTSCSLFPIEGNSSYHGYQYSSSNQNASSTISANKISSAEDLKQLNNSKGNYVLENDIDLSSVSNWTPINGFAGTLDGNSHKIKNLKINSSSDKNLGLFGELKGKVSNLTIEGDIAVSGQTENLGMLAGTNSGVIDNVNVSGSIESEFSSYIGGLFGKSTTGKITNITSSVNIKGEKYLGGVVGHMTLENNYSPSKYNYSGSLSGKDEVGGIIGHLQTSAPSSYNNMTVTISEANNSGSVTSTGNNVGGMIGSQNSSAKSGYYTYISVINSSNSGLIKGKKYTGGLIGSASYLSSLKSSTNTSSIEGEDYTGGYVGYAPNASLENLKNDHSITGNGYLGGIAGYAGSISSCKNTGSINSTTFILENSNPVASVGGVAGFCTLINDCSNTADISISHGGKRVGGVAGVINIAEGKECKNNTNSGNITVEDSNCVGGIVGRILAQAPSSYNNTSFTFSGNTNSGKITSKGLYTGGLIGIQESGAKSGYYNHINITNGTNSGNVESTNDYVGSLIGRADYASLINSSQNTGEITGGAYTGGFAGYAVNASFKNLTNNVKVTGKSYLGGIAGYGGSFENCKNKGQIAFTNYIMDGSTRVGCIGGVAGFATSLTDCSNEIDIDVKYDCVRVGGIAGEMLINEKTEIKGNTNSGNITSKGNSVGGIVGKVTCNAPSSYNNLNASFSNNTNSGSIVTLGEYAGGIVGYQGSNAKGGYYVYISFSNCQSLGDVKSSSYAGGIVGCGTKVTDQSAIWSSNTVTGNITANSNSGIYYGKINS